MTTRRDHFLSTRLTTWLTIIALYWVSWFVLPGCAGSSKRAMAPQQRATMSPTSVSDYAEGGDEVAPMALGAPPPMDNFDEEATATSEAAPAPLPAPAASPVATTIAKKLESSAVVGKPKLAANTAKTSPGSGRATPRNASDGVIIQQVLIYTADFRMAVFEVDESMDKLEKLARSLGGFLARRSSNEIVIRVPAARFQQAVQGTVELGDVLERNIQVQDVTEQVTDLLLRLHNARQVRDRIAQLLAQSKTVKDSLRIERELARISEQIERMEGRLKLLRNKAQYSTLTVRFTKKGSDDDVGKSIFNLPFPWLNNLGLGRLTNLNY